MGPISTKPHANTKEVFWGEISPCEHLIQIYNDDAAFLDTLEGFVAGGIRSGEAVVVIATAAHRAALDERLRAREVFLDADRLADQYFAYDAEQTLSTFMVDGWPDERLFERCVADLLERTAGQARGRPVRAFGEMVALLWAQGHAGATLRLEHLWHRMCHERRFSLFCAYPRLGFAPDAIASLKEICALHSRHLQV
jgi:MEDS: MEthanogen/methylotroph, DcmR Sensory domain